MSESKDTRPGSLISSAVNSEFKDAITKEYVKHSPIVGVVAELTTSDFERCKDIFTVEPINKPMPRFEKVTLPSFEIKGDLQPAKILMNQQDWDDILQWGAEQGIVVDPVLKEARDKAKEIISTSEDEDQVASAMEVLIITSAAENERDVTFGSLAAMDITNVIEANSVKDMQDSED